ncbi:MAG: hypothetical protein ACR2LJ_08165, partial [Acidimicrobiales bacterium]
MQVRNAADLELCGQPRFCEKCAAVTTSVVSQSARAGEKAARPRGPSRTTIQPRVQPATAPVEVGQNVAPAVRTNDADGLRASETSSISGVNGSGEGSATAAALADAQQQASELRASAEADATRIRQATDDDREQARVGLAAARSAADSDRQQAAAALTEAQTQAADVVAA